MCLYNITPKKNLRPQQSPCRMWICSWQKSNRTKPQQQHRGKKGHKPVGPWFLPVTSPCQILVDQQHLSRKEKENMKKL